MMAHSCRELRHIAVGGGIVRASIATEEWAKSIEAAGIHLFNLRRSRRFGHDDILWLRRRAQLHVGR